ncbi:MAG TPA: M64 family metallopeptidase [Candidatus Acidoferrum sp.]|nr:M64 family metallopeptidase [Candidatus Acidoferrum sp.]
MTRKFPHCRLPRFTIVLVMAAALAFGLACRAGAQAPVVAFDDYFINAALRLEIYEVGDAKEEIITEHAIYEEPVWPENPRALIQPFEVGRYCLKVYDKNSNRLIYSRGFNPMFAEYKTTQPALDGVKRAYEAVLRFPCPKKPVLAVVERRDKFNVPVPLYTTTVDPNDFHIIRENASLGDTIFEIQKTGDPHDRVDFVFLAEGYTAEDKDKFKKDAERMTDYLFSMEPYKTNKDRFNINAIFRASAERGMDEPVQRRYKNTALNASYNSFEEDRYLLVQDSFALHRMAAQVPYDCIIVLVNTARYGGGSICLDYCITSVDNSSSQRVFIHELGHAFAFLADEYQGNVSYNDMYPKGVEPLDPNITEMLDPANLKWKALLTPGIALPTPPAQTETAALGLELRNLTDGMSDEQLANLDAGVKARQAEIEAAIAGLPRRVGAFEGAGYLKTGMYRPQENCVMNALRPNDQFCAVCKWALQRMIDYYAPPAP